MGLVLKKINCLEISEDINIQFSCGNGDSSGLIGVLVSLENPAQKLVNLFSLYEFHDERYTY